MGRIAPGVVSAIVPYFSVLPRSLGGQSPAIPTRAVVLPNFELNLRSRRQVLLESYCELGGGLLRGYYSSCR